MENAVAVKECEAMSEPFWGTTSLQVCLPLSLRVSRRRRLQRAFLLPALFALISTGKLHAQVLQPPPFDPLELVTGRAELLITPEQRQPVIDMLTKVQRNFSVSMSDNPYTLKVSFTAS